MLRDLQGDGLPAGLSADASVDIVVGLPSYRNAATIGSVIQSTLESIRKHYAGLSFLIVNADAESPDATAEVVEQFRSRGEAVVCLTNPLPLVDRLRHPFHGRVGRGTGTQRILEAAHQLDARACILLDPAQPGITPGWFDCLLRPVLHGDYDFVAPDYHRRSYEGTLVSGFVYPLTRALYGVRLRQPVGADFGLSNRFVARLLDRDDWETDLTRFSVDLWMSTIAVAEGFRVCQTYLGERWHPPVQGAGEHISDLCRQIADSLFALMTQYEEVWKLQSGSRPCEQFGVPPASSGNLPVVPIAPLLDSFARGCDDLLEVWAVALDPATTKEVSALALAARARSSAFHLSDELWARIVCELAAAYDQRPLERSHLLNSFSPLYLAWVASFMLETAGRPFSYGEERIEQLALALEASKPHLSRLWDYYRPAQTQDWELDLRSGTK